MKPGDHDSESPTAYALRSGIGYNRLTPADIISWFLGPKNVLDLAVDAYWRNSALRTEQAS